jgi:F-type H+-transporting ATPase subunit alpha
LPDLFFAGVKPAVDVGISVSRVGGKAQVKSMKKVAGTLRLDLAAFRELEAFTQLGTELDAATQRQLDRGRRMVELLKQPQYQPFHVADQVISIFAGTEGYLDDISEGKVRGFENSLLAYMKEQGKDVRDKLIKTNDLSEELTQALHEHVKKFKESWKEKN